MPDSDRTKTCWFCGTPTMNPAPKYGKNWYMCSKCGATWYPVPSETFAAITYHPATQKRPVIAYSHPVRRKKPALDLND